MQSFHLQERLSSAPAAEDTLVPVAALEGAGVLVFELLLDPEDCTAVSLGADMMITDLPARCFEGVLCGVQFCREPRFLRCLGDGPWGAVLAESDLLQENGGRT